MSKRLRIQRPEYPQMRSHLDRLQSTVRSSLLAGNVNEAFLHIQTFQSWIEKPRTLRHRPDIDFESWLSPRQLQVLKTQLDAFQTDLTNWSAGMALPSLIYTLEHYDAPPSKPKFLFFHHWTPLASQLIFSKVPFFNNKAQPTSPE